MEEVSAENADFEGELSFNGRTLCIPSLSEAQSAAQGPGSDQENESPLLQDTAATSSIRTSSRFQLPVSPPHSAHSTAAANENTTASTTPEAVSPRAGSSFINTLDSQTITNQRSWVRRVQSRTDELRKLFGLDPTEQLMDDYMCALKKKVLLQGRLFVFERHLCFYSSLFGYHKVKIIPLAAIADISKKKNVGFPNSIQVIWDAGSAGAKKEFFTSFLSREDAYRLMLGLWARCSDRGRERAALELGPATDTDDGGEGPQTSRNLSKRWSMWSKSNTAGAEAGSENRPSIEERLTTQTSVIELGDSVVSGVSSLPNAAADGPAANEPLAWMSDRPLSPPPVDSATVLSDNEDTDLVVRPSFVPGSTSVREFVEGPPCDDSWIVKEFDTAVDAAPPVAKSMQRVLKTNLPTTPLGFYRAFLCPTSDFFVSFHESQGHHTIELSPWHCHYKVGPVRDLRFITPLKGWRIGPPQALCHQTQRFKVHTGQHVVFETSQVMNDIPYGDHFRVDQRWDVTPAEDSPGECSLEVHISVPFTKNTLWKRVIEKSVTDSTLEAFRMFRELADKQLEKELALQQVAGTPMSTPGHRKTLSRPSSPEETLPATNEEWEELLSSVEPQWRGGLRALRRMQLAAGSGSNAGGTQSHPSLPGVPRHRRRGSRASRSGTIGFEFQQIQTGSGMNGSGSYYPKSPKLPRVLESKAMLVSSPTSSTDEGKASFRSRAASFFDKRWNVLLLCLLCAVIIALQMVLLTVQLQRTAYLSEPINGDGSGPARLDLVREVSSLASELQMLQRETETWAGRAETTLRSAAGLADRIKRLQTALKL